MSHDIAQLRERGITWSSIAVFAETWVYIRANDATSRSSHDYLRLKAIVANGGEGLGLPEYFCSN